MQGLQAGCKARAQGHWRSSSDFKGGKPHVPPVWLPLVLPWHVDILSRIGLHDGALHLDEGRRGRVLGIELAAPAVVDLGRGGED